MTLNFSQYLFWDVDSTTINQETHASYIVSRVLEIGQLDDWKLLLRLYGLERIISIAKDLRTLDSKAVAFLSTISGVPKTEFRCYTEKL